MNLYYLFDEDARRQRNAQGLDYTPAYLPAMLAFMGATAQPIAPSALARLQEDDVLLVGAEHPEILPLCRVIRMGREMAERTGGVKAYFCTGEGEKLPLFVPLGEPCRSGETLATARDTDGRERPALIGAQGYFEFCFDLPATLWYGGDGFLPEPAPDYFFIGRVPDYRPLGQTGEWAVAFHDRLLELLESILLSMGVPLIHRLPPMEDGRCPDAALHVSGDDDCTSRDYNLQAALTMESFGIPYHINAMASAGQAFVFDAALYRELAAHGCEVGLHTDFTDGVPHEGASVRAQAELFERTFGEPPRTNSNHCFIQGGSAAERLRWLEASGMLADNSKLGEFDPANINAFDLCGCGFGTYFPRFTCEDAAHQNRMLSCMEIPINYYEPRPVESTEKLVRYLEAAVANERVVQLFLHPHYFAESSRHRPAVLRALQTVRDFCDRNEGKILLLTTNRLAAFWRARAEASVQLRGDRLCVTSDVPLTIRTRSGLHYVPAGKMVKAKSEE